MSATALRVVRRTALGEDQKHVRFLQIDNDIADLLTSREATRVSTCLHNVYTRMKLALRRHQSQPGVLRIEGVTRDGEYLTPWEHLKEITQVSDATLSKCLDFLEETGIIGRRSHYRNGLPIFIWFNHAESSVLTAASAPPAPPSAFRKAEPPGQKNLRLVKASREGGDTSPGAVSFNEAHGSETVRDSHHAPPDGDATCPLPGTELTTHGATQQQGQSAEAAKLEPPASPPPGISGQALPELLTYVEAAVGRAMSQSVGGAVKLLREQTAAAVSESGERLLQAIWGASETLHTHIEKSAARAGRVGSAEAIKTAQKQGWIRKPADNAKVGAAPASSAVPERAAPRGGATQATISAAVEYAAMLCRLQPSLTPEEVLGRWAGEADFKFTDEECRRILRGVRGALSSPTGGAAGKEAGHEPRTS